MSRSTIFLLALLGVFALFILYSSTAKATTVTTSGGGGTTTGGLGGLLSGIPGWLQGLFGPKKPTQTTCCDESRPGYDCNGFPNADCGFGG